MKAPGSPRGKGGASAAGSGAAKFAWTKIFGSEARAAEEVMAMAIIRVIEESTPGSDQRGEAWWSRAGQRLIKPFVNYDVAGSVLNTVIADPENTEAMRETLIVALGRAGHNFPELADAFEFNADQFLSAIPSILLDELMTAAAEPNSRSLARAQFATLRQIAALQAREPTGPESRPAGLASKIWRAPARNPNFTGRDEALADLQTKLIAGSTVTVYSISGLGGIGKTQLAIEYAHRYAGDYDIVWWVPAEEAATIASYFAALAARLGLASEGTPEEIRSAVQEAFGTTDGWLLVFDNADSVEDVEWWMPTVPMQTGTAGHVIVTTRRRGFRRIGSVLELDVIDMNAAVHILQSRVSTLQRPDAESIAELLGRLPLAIEQAAAYLDRTQIPPAEFLELLRTRQSAMFAAMAHEVRDRSVVTLWELSLNQIEAENPAALLILDVSAYMAPEAIPLDLFTNNPDRLPPPLSSAAADPLKFNSAIGTILGYSMAQRAESGLQLHRLVQAALRVRHAKFAS